LTIGKQAVVIKNELDQAASRIGNGVEMLFLKTGNEQQRSGIDFHSGRTQVVIATLRQESERKGCSRIGRQGKARHVELPCGDKRRDSSMHIVIDPGGGVLRWSEFTKRRVRMRIDETRNGCYAAGVDDDLGTAADRRSDLLDDSILDIYRIGCAGVDWCAEVVCPRRVKPGKVHKRHKTNSKKHKNFFLCRFVIFLVPLLVRSALSAFGFDKLCRVNTADSRYIYTCRR